jgi:hypothetical protein
MVKCNDPICDFDAWADLGSIVLPLFGVKNRVVLHARLPHIGDRWR